MDMTLAWDPDDLVVLIDSEPHIEAAEYLRIMPRTGVDGNETVTGVSAFNSSI